jgi:serpin B
LETLVKIAYAWCIPLSWLVACGGGAAQSDGLVMAQPPRVAATAADDVGTQVHDDSDFAFALYGQLARQPGNLFFSPHSVSSALAMTWTGAAGATSVDMAAALRFSMPQDRVGAAFSSLAATLRSRADGPGGESGAAFKLAVVDALWAQRGTPLQQPFVDALAADYGAGVHLEDFVAAPESARGEINAWVSDNSAGQIPELLADGAITSGTRLVLTNAVYFSGAWRMPFATSATVPAPFHALDGTTPSVPQMNGSFSTAYAAGAGWQAVELPYSNPALTLTVIVPDAGSFAAVESQLSGEFLAALLAAEKLAQVSLALPKFAASTRASLEQPLAALGMGGAFSQSTANFSGIDGKRDLVIDDIVHQATITIDENGTQAAAASGTVVRPTLAYQPVTLTIDRPFLVVLRDLPTGALLFVGRITQP